jgi:hypothetical protein
VWRLVRNTAGAREADERGREFVTADGATAKGGAGDPLQAVAQWEAGALPAACGAWRARTSWSARPHATG